MTVFHQQNSRQEDYGPLTSQSCCEGQSEIIGLNKMQGIVFISRTGRNTKLTDFLASRKLPEYYFTWTFIPRILNIAHTVPCHASMSRLFGHGEAGINLGPAVNSYKCPHSSGLIRHCIELEYSIVTILTSLLQSIQFLRNVQGTSYTSRRASSVSEWYTSLLRPPCCCLLSCFSIMFCALTLHNVPKS